MRRLIILLLIPLVLFSSCTREKEDVQDDVLYLRYADNQPYDYPTSRAAVYFSNLVEERTNGRVLIEVIPDGVLGPETSVLQQMKFGGIDFARFSLGILCDEYPEFAVLTLPFLYRDKSHMWSVLDSEVGEHFLGLLDDSHIQGLAWLDAGARSFYTSRPVHSVEDLKGMRIRVQETELMERMFALLEVEPVKVPYGDVYSVLRQKIVDGAENNFPSYFHTGHYEQSPYFYKTEHMRLPELMMISAATRKRIEAVDPELFEIISECAREAGEYERILWVQEEVEAARFCQEHGVEIIIPTAEDRFKLRNATHAIYDEFSEYEDLIMQIQNM